MTKNYQARRNFLKRSAQLAVLGSGAAAVSGKMSLIGSALAANSDPLNLPDYKALVCIFLNGGSDSFNMFVPAEQSLFEDYQSARGSLAISQANLIRDRGETVNFHRHLDKLRDAYDGGNLAIVRNVGNLIQPVTPAQFQNNPELIPPDLFAHNSQTEQVQKSWSSRPVGLVGAGWGGRMADLLTEANAGSTLPPTFSMNNANFFQPGFSTTPISVNPKTGPSLLPYLDAGRSGSNQGRELAMDRILGLQSNNLIENSARDAFINARDSSRSLSSVIAASPDLGPIDTNNKLEVQLRMIARMIAGRGQLQQKRQIFYASLGGWDTHDNQTPRLDALMLQLNSALASFQQALKTLEVEDKVTTFTASEFGRTLTINGDGSDHGWGGHYLVMGGAVNGGRLYGQWPEYRLGGRDDIGKGRIIPQLSINQYGAALGSWMGLSNAELLDIFPDLNRFETGWQKQYGLFG